MTETPHDTAATGDQGPRVSTEQMRDVKRLRRSVSDRRIAGVAGGIGRHLDVDPTLVRVVLVVLAFFGGAGLVIYGTCWLLVPEEGSDEAPIAASTEVRTIGVIAALVVAALLLLGNGWWFGFGSGWPAPLPLLVIAGLVVFLALRNRGRGQAAPPPYPPDPPRGPSEPGYAGSPPGSGYPAAGYTQTPYGGPGQPPPPPPAPAYLPPQPPPPPPPRERRGQSLFGLTAGLVVFVLGIVAWVEVAVAPLPWAAYPAAALAVIGLALVVAAFVGRSGGLTFLGLLAGAVLAVAVWAPELRFGETVAHPTSAAQLQDRYAFTAGRIHLDLTDIRDLEQLDGRVLDLSMRAGQVIVDLPAEGLDVDVSSEAEGGQLVVLGNMAEGSTISNDRSTGDTAAPDLRINLDLGFGHARVSTP